MIDVKEVMNSDILVMRVTGKLTKDDLDKLISPLQKHVKNSDNSHLPMIMENFKGWESAAAFWKNLKLDAEYIGHLDKIALVGDEQWEQWLIYLMNTLAKAEMKFFETDEADSARNWIN